MVLAARGLEAMESLAGEIVASGGVALAHRCDVTAYDDVAALVEKTVGQFGRLDVLVNNAGLLDPIAHLGTSDVERWSHCVDVNLKGVYHALRAALPVMEKAGKGTIINMSSGAATSALEAWSSCCATKAAVQMLTACAHKEYASHGVTVVGLSPGTVATEMQAKIRKSGINPVSQMDWSRHIPPEWAAKAVAFLIEHGDVYAGTDFSIKTAEGRRRVGLPELS